MESPADQNPPPPPPPGPFDQSDSYRTLALDVEGRRFWVSRELLATYSPVFAAMLYGQFDEANKDVIELPNKKAAEFEEFLSCLIPMPMTKKIDESNAHLTLTYAKEYLIDEMRQRSIDALKEMTTQWDQNDRRLLEILRIASDHRLIDVLKPLVKKCALGFELEKMTPMFEVLRSEVIAALSLYKNVIPSDRRCKFDYHETDCYYNIEICNTHENNQYLVCVYCRAKGCSECLQEKKPALIKRTCGMTGIWKAEKEVHDLLDRLADD